MQIRMPTMIRIPTVLAILLAITVGPSAAQQIAVPEKGLVLTRANLLFEMAQLDLTSTNEELEDYEREWAVRRGDDIRARLQLGDFRQGDPVGIKVTGIPLLPEQLTVEPGPNLFFPDLNERISLAGVLRSELEAHLTTELKQWIKDPQVQASSLIRLTVTGGVRNPSSYSLAPDTPFPDVIIAAGGFTATSSYEGAKIQRGGTDIWKGDELQDAIRRGETLDQMHLQAGDEIVVDVPGPNGGGFGSVLRYVLPIGTAVITALLIGRR